MPSHTGFSADLDTPRIATSGALMIGVNPVPPIPPSELMVKQPPCIWSGLSLPSRAAAASSPISLAICMTPFLSASRSTGTTRPFGVSAANPTCTYCFSTSWSPSSEALKFGNFCNAATQALIRNASMVTLPALPAAMALAFSSFSATRKASRSVMSASSNWVTCGIIAQLRARFAPEIFWMRDNGLVSIGPNFAKSTFGHGMRLSPPPPETPAGAAAAPPASADLTYFCTSSLPMRPPRSLPVTCSRSTPSSRANRRTAGLA